MKTSLAKTYTLSSTKTDQLDHLQATRWIRPICVSWSFSFTWVPWPTSHLVGWGLVHIMLSGFNLVGERGSCPQTLIDNLLPWCIEVTFCTQHIYSSDILNYSNNYNYHNYDIQNSMIDNICTERSAVQLASVGARSGSSQLYIDKIWSALRHIWMFISLPNRCHKTSRE